MGARECRCCTPELDADVNIGKIITSPVIQEAVEVPFPEESPEPKGFSAETPVPLAVAPVVSSKFCDRTQEIRKSKEQINASPSSRTTGGQQHDTSPRKRVCLLEELENFRQERDADRKSRLKTVATVGFWALGVSASVGLATCASLYAGGPDLWGAGSPICAFIVAIAMSILSSIDETYYDYNAEFIAHLKLRLTFWALMVSLSLRRLFEVLGLSDLNTSGKLFIAMALASTCLQIANCFYALRGANFPKQTFLCACQFQLFSLDAVMMEYIIPQPTREAKPCARRARGPELLFLGIFVILAFQAFFCRRQRQLQLGMSNSNTSAQKFMYHSWYLFMFIWGFLNFIKGMRMLALSCPTHTILPAIITGIAFLLLFCMVVLLPTDFLFLWVARRFDHDPQRLHRDGAFLASLLDKVVVAPGDIMWVHHGQDDQRYESSDPRRNWEKGIVASVSDEIIVHTVTHSSSNPSRLFCTADGSRTLGSLQSLTGSSVLSRLTFMRGRSGTTSIVDPEIDDRRSQSTARIPSVSKIVFNRLAFMRGRSGTTNISDPEIGESRPSSSARIFNRLAFLRGRSGTTNISEPETGEDGPPSAARVPSVSKSIVHHLPLQGSAQSADEILEYAQANLRCIEWMHMSEELMATNRITEKTEHISRLVRKGERVDFFLSHSWHDDPKLKWQCLTSIAGEFHRAHSRYPTFWLDKVCIKPSDISDGLKALPVNVLACRKLLVCCGETYVERLWCIWEIYTLFAFSREEQALERLLLVPFGNSNILEKLKRFDARKAKCYDPNEQARLMNVIRAGDVKIFNNKICRLAVALDSRTKSSSDAWIPMVRQLSPIGSFSIIPFGTSSLNFSRGPQVNYSVPSENEQALEESKYGIEGLRCQSGIAAFEKQSSCDKGEALHDCASLVGIQEPLQRRVFLL